MTALLKVKIGSGSIVCAMLLFFCAGPLAQAGAMSGSPKASAAIIETQAGLVSFEVETATTTDQQQRGLMYRREMADDHGMIFLFSPARPVFFTMRNTYIPLDMIYILPDGTIESINAQTTPLDPGPFPSEGVVRAVLEINGGLAETLGIRPGDQVRHPLLENVED
jgi:uncharacterized membrane protein (UPF0127 family)